MKKETHPKYGQATFRCACGNVIETRSTLEGTTQIEVCSACHPFYTGKQKLVDTAGRIDRFKKKFGTRIALGGVKKRKSKPRASAGGSEEPQGSQENQSAEEKSSE